MALVNEAKREINAKIVYIGPKGAGKSTAIRSIYSSLRPEYRSDLKTLASGGNQMLFFDYSYPNNQVAGSYTIRFHLYSIISDGITPPPWKMLLKGVDGIIFMADSSKGRMFANLECCAQLFDAFAHYGIKGGEIPLWLQCNKRDIPGAVAMATLKGELFPELRGEPLAVSALTGEGLLEGLSAVSAAIMRKHGVETASKEAVVEASHSHGTDPIEEQFDAVPYTGGHCGNLAKPFKVELAGDPQSGEGSEILIPLRLAGGECGKSIDFTVKVSVSL